MDIILQWCQDNQLVNAQEKGERRERERWMKERERVRDEWKKERERKRWMKERDRDEWKRQIDEWISFNFTHGSLYFSLIWAEPSVT